MAQHLDENGGANCCSCKKYSKVTEGLELCNGCENFVCSSCKKFPKQNPTLGYLCKKCIKNA
jgi:hypothetical protein